MQAKLQKQLKPLVELVEELAADAKAGYVPDFRAYAEWQQDKARAAAEADRNMADLALPQEFEGQAHNSLDVQPAGQAAAYAHLHALCLMPHVRILEYDHTATLWIVCSL